MKKIIEKIKSILSSKCRFKDQCPYYQPDGVTCNHSTAQDGFCGKYKEFEEMKKN